MTLDARTVSRIKTLYKSTFTRVLVFICLVAIIEFPLATRAIISPMFTKLLVEQTVVEAQRVARSLAFSLDLKEADFHRGMLTSDSLTNLEREIKQFDLVKLKIFSKSGEVVYSTDPQEVGSINKKPYFHKHVAKGYTYSMVVKQRAKSLEDQVVAADLVETYVPLMKDERLQGAFEISYDITSRLSRLNLLITRSTVILFVLALGLFVTVVVTANKAAATEKALLESIQYLNSLIESSADAIISTDRDGNVVLFNEGGEALLGYRREEIASRYVTDLYENEEGAKEVMSRMREGGGTVSALETLLKAKDGSLIPVLISAAILYDEEGNEAGTVGFNKDIRERKQAQEALERLSRKNELILNSAGEGIYGLDLEGRTTFCNPAAAQMIGWDVEELIGQPQHDILHHTKSDGTPYPREECPIYSALKDGLIHHVTDDVFWRKDGTCFPVEYTSTPIRDERGELAGAVVTFRDINERKQAEEALSQANSTLQETKQYLESLIESTTDAILATDRDGKITLFNEGAEALSGYRREEVIGRRGPVLYERAEDAKEVMRRMHEDGGRLSSFETTFRTKDGTIIPVLISASLLYDEEGREVGAVGFSKDLRERKQAEERYRALVESSPGPIKLLDLDGTIIACNAAAVQCFDLERKENLIGQNLIFLFSEKNRPHLEEALEKVRQGQEARLEVQTTTPEGASKWFGITANPIPDEAGRVINILFAGRDITERQEMEQKLLELATTDALTKLYNRAYFTSKLEEEFQRAVRYKTPLSLMLIDIDHFKTVNDHFGHQAGDAYLEAVSGLIASAVRQMDTVARYGGEELAILLPNTDLGDTVALAERLRNSVATFEVLIGSNAIRCTISVGVASYPVGAAKTVDELLTAADRALYAAKRGGRNWVVAYREGMESTPA